MTPSVIILGGGFAGLSCALNLPAKRFQVMLVDQNPHFEFIPNIHELLSASKGAADLRLPLGRLMRDRGHRFHRGRAVRIDPDACSITLENGRELAADYLVLATGSVEADFGIPGVSRYGYPLKCVADGRAIAAALGGRDRSAQTRVTVVGAGLAGVEAVGELLRRRHPPGKIRLVDVQSRILPNTPAPVGDFIEAQCRKRNVELYLGTPVKRMTKKTVWLADGSRLQSDLVIWAAGPAPAPVLAASGLARQGRWPRVNADLTLPAQPNVFVAGDSAQLPEPLSRQAYFAMDMGSLAADNLLRLRQGRATRALRPLPRPTLLAFGDITTVLIAGRRAWASSALIALKEGVYSLAMAQLDVRRPQGRVSGLLERGKSSVQGVWPVIASPRLLSASGRWQRLS